MAWVRYLLYFFAISLITWLLVWMEISFPGSLKLNIFLSPTDQLGTSEFSPLEIIQTLILVTCALMMLWIARYCPSQQPIAVLCGALAIAFLIRELDYFFDRYLLDNLWQVPIGIVAAVVITYTYRHTRRLRIALARLWPSPALALLFAGAVILFAFAQLMGHEPLWKAIMGSNYQRVVKLAVEEFTELMGYFLWLIGTIEYAFQARAIAYREPQPAAYRRREKRRHDREGQY
jgi:hypothetical protein